MADSIGIAVIGVGRIGRLHADNIAFRIPGARLAAVCDIDTMALARARADLGVPTFRTVEDLLAQPDVDAVVVSSTAQTHTAIITAAVRAGKYIFSEKPIGLTLEETDAVLQQVVDASLQFQIGFQRRWDPAYLAARHYIEAGTIGQPVLFKAHGRDPQSAGASWHDPKKSGGIFLDAAIHDYDAARFLMACEISRVSASGATLVHHDLNTVGDIDTCFTILTFGDRAMGITEWSRYAVYGYDIYAEVLGTEGALRIGTLQRTPVLVLTRAGVSHSTVPGFIERFDEAYLAELRAFVEAIRGGQPATPGVEDARIAVHVALLARKSFERGEAVEVPALQALSPSHRSQ